VNLLDGEQFDIKVEDGVAWDDATSAALSVTEAGGNDNFPTLANFHGSEGLQSKWWYMHTNIWNFNRKMICERR